MHSFKLPQPRRRGHWNAAGKWAGNIFLTKSFEALSSNQYMPPFSCSQNYLRRSEREIAGVTRCSCTVAVSRGIKRYLKHRRIWKCRVVSHKFKFKKAMWKRRSAPLERLLDSNRRGQNLVWPPKRKGNCEKMKRFSKIKFKTCSWESSTYRLWNYT